MGKFKVNFKDASCQYVEEYNAGKYGTKIKIYFCEGDAVTPKEYSGSVGAKIITAETIEELKKKLDEAVANRDKEIAKTLTDSKKIKAKDSDYAPIGYWELRDYSNKYISKKQLSEYLKQAITNLSKEYPDLNNYRYSISEPQLTNLGNQYFRLTRQIQVGYGLVEQLMLESRTDGMYLFAVRIDSDPKFKALAEEINKLIYPGFNSSVRIKDSKKVKDGVLEDLQKEQERNLSNWGKEEADIWRKTDWKARKYEPLLVPSNSFVKDVKVIGADNILKNVKFVLEISPNSIYEPRYVPLEQYSKYKDYAWTYDGTTKNGYPVLDRADTWESYNMLFDSKYSKKKVKDYDDLDNEWDYDIECEGNQWSDGGFETPEEAEDEALAKVNELLEDFPEGYAVDDFDIVIVNRYTGEHYVYNPYEINDCNFATLTPGKVNLKKDSKKFNQKDCGFKDSDQTDILEEIKSKYPGAKFKWVYFNKNSKNENFDFVIYGDLPKNLDRFDHTKKVAFERFVKYVMEKRGFIAVTVYTNRDYETGGIYVSVTGHKFNIVKDCGIKSRNFKDASADEIIDLFEEAYIKGRSWDWLKSKLPTKFLNMQNKHWKNIFPIQADRTGKLEGVYLTRPEQLSKDKQEEISKFIDDLDNYISHVQHLRADYGIDTGNFNIYNILEAIDKAIENTDSKKESEDLAQTRKNIKSVWSDLEYSARNLPGVKTYSEYVDNYIKAYDKGEESLRRYLMKLINNSRPGEDYREEQKEPLIRAREGGFIRSDSKVGPLSEEAKSYIRRVMKGSTTEEMEAKRESRQARREPYYYGSRGDRGIKKFDREIEDIKTLLRGLKSEVAKEKRMDIDVSNRKHGYYKYTGKGDYDYNGRWRQNGGYSWTSETQPTTVRIDVEGLGELSTALGRILNSGTVNEVEENLRKALEVTKKLPRNNPKVAEIKAKIKTLLENRKNAPKIRRPLPDKKFVRDSFNDKELKEYMSLCKKLGLLTQGDIQNFSKKHGNVTDKKLLEALRKEANKK